MKNSLKKLLLFTFYSLPLITFVALGSEHRVQGASMAPVPDLSGAVKVTINKSRGVPGANLSLASAISRRPQGGLTTSAQLAAYIQSQALKHGVSPAVALWIVRHESQFNPRAKGDGEASRGLWQISKIYHPEVSDAMAFSVRSSTQWSLERIRSGKANEWST
ncbi:MAG TPA: transglycosylase SLT domain-containing protein, partial [Candidatus Acidoferrales bacterium]|nr:transglycosylase SLT domain-containing protein [Candidatus Acidoferrales bacterium]